jgi:hypothetical protein
MDAPVPQRRSSEYEIHYNGRPYSERYYEILATRQGCAINAGLGVLRRTCIRCLFLLQAHLSL